MSQSIPLSLPLDVDSVKVVDEKTHSVESEEKERLETKDSSIVASLAGSDAEKSAESRGDGIAHEGKDETEPPNLVQYPKGIEMFCIMLALVLSITLCSLDQVSSTAPIICRSPFTLSLSYADDLTPWNQTIVATAVPKITDEFGRLQDISWYGSAYFLSLGAFQSQWGKVYKFFPLKTSFLVAILIFELGSLISAVARNSATVIVGRAIAGMGASGIAPGVYTISTFAAEPVKRATYTGLIGMTYGVVAVAGPLIGGALTDAASWRW